MISDEVIQAAIIAKLKSFTTLTALLAEGVSGIKEYQWQGDTFKYPAVRLDLESNGYTFDANGQCTSQDIEFSLYFYSEEKSSKQCSQLKGITINLLVGKGFTQNGLRFSELRLERGGNIPAMREDEHTWRSQVKLNSMVTIAS